MRLAFLLTLFTAWLLAAEQSAVKAAEKPGSPDRYVMLYERIFARGEASASKLTAYDRLCLADLAMRLERRTGKADYLGKAVGFFDAALPEVSRHPADFHTLRMVSHLIGPLEQKGLIKPENKSLLRSIAGRSWQQFLAHPDGSAEGDVDHNIRLAEALGCAALANFFPADPTPESQAIRQRLALYWDKIKATGDLDEDASNYTALGIIHCIELAQALGREQDLKSPGFRRMFERQRDIISPTGLLPEFGDGFFHLERDAFDFLYVCEYAATAFDDPTYLTVARRLFDASSFATATTDKWSRASALVGLELSPREPAPLPAASVVSYRATRSSPQPVVDKLILRTGTEAGSAMVMLDLYASGSHAHRAKGPSVAYFEANGVPLFHNLGRHRTRSAITGNSFWALDGERSFPGVWKPGEWFTMSIPPEMLNRLADGTMKIGDRVTLRNFDKNGGTKKLWFDNLRLEGPRGTKLLDGFESPKDWHRNMTSARAIKVETSPERTQGEASQAVNWGVLKAGVFARMLADGRDFIFAPGEFDALKLDVRYDGIRPYLHLRDLCQQIDLGDHALPYAVANARVEQHGNDAFGEVKFDAYVTGDSKLTRRIVLTSEGCLIIHDQWTAGTSKPRWTAGQLWQFYALKERGQDWFCSEDDGAYLVPNSMGGADSVSRRMLVKFATPVDTEAFIEQIDQSYLAPNPKKRPQDKFFTTGSRRLVKPGTQESFTMVVVPHAPGLTPEGIASDIRISEHAERTEIKLGTTSTPSGARVTIRRDGSWEVLRGKHELSGK